MTLWPLALGRGQRAAARRNCRDDDDEDVRDAEADPDRAEDDAGDRHAAPALGPARLVDLPTGDVANTRARIPPMMHRKIWAIPSTNDAIASPFVLGVD